MKIKENIVRNRLLHVVDSPRLASSGIENSAADKKFFVARSRKNMMSQLSDAKTKITDAGIIDIHCSNGIISMRSQDMACRCRR